MALKKELNQAFLNQITSRIITDQLVRQQEKGVSKYGRLADEAADKLSSSELAQHALEEAVDGAYYAAMLVSKMETMTLIWNDVLIALESHLAAYECNGSFDDDDLVYDLKKLVACFRGTSADTDDGDDN